MAKKAVSTKTIKSDQETKKSAPKKPAKQKKTLSKVNKGDSSKSASKAGVKSANGLLEKDKQTLIKEFAQKTGDTGSPEVQVALATHKIFNLSNHLGENPKDNHSRRGLLKIIAKRRRILNYLEDKDSDRYQQLLKKLHLKK